MAKKNRKYYFLDREKLRRSLDRTNILVEKMYEGFHEFKELREVLGKDDFIEFTNLESRSGITDKLIEKLENAVEKFRNLYMERNTDIFQTTIEDFVDPE